MAEEAVATDSADHEAYFRAICYCLLYIQPYFEGSVEAFLFIKLQTYFTVH